MLNKKLREEHEEKITQLVADKEAVELKLRAADVELQLLKNNAEEMQQQLKILEEKIGALNSEIKLKKDELQKTLTHKEQLLTERDDLKAKLLTTESHKLELAKNLDVFKKENEAARNNLQQKNQVLANENSRLRKTLQIQNIELFQLINECSELRERVSYKDDNERPETVEPMLSPRTSTPPCPSSFFQAFPASTPTNTTDSQTTALTSHSQAEGGRASAPKKSLSSTSGALPSPRIINSTSVMVVEKLPWDFTEFSCDRLKLKDARTPAVIASDIWREFIYRYNDIAHNQGLWAEAYVFIFLINHYVDKFAQDESDIELPTPYDITEPLEAGGSYRSFKSAVTVRDSSKDRLIQIMWFNNEQDHRTGNRDIDVKKFIRGKEEEAKTCFIEVKSHIQNDNRSSFTRGEIDLFLKVKRENRSRTAKKTKTRIYQVNWVGTPQTSLQIKEFPFNEEVEVYNHSSSFKLTI